jgi:hypothetical protein
MAAKWSGTSNDQIAARGVAGLGDLCNAASGVFKLKSKNNRPWLPGQIRFSYKTLPGKQLWRSLPVQEIKRTG